MECRMRRTALFLSFFVFFVAGTISFLKASPISKKRPDMKSIIAVLKSQNISHYVFTNSRGSEFLVVPMFGARILAVSVDSENLFWTHPEILRGMGGQRTWISPEGGAKGFLFKPDWNGTRDFSMMDPGRYKVETYKENERLVLQNSFQTTSNDKQDLYDLTVTRDIRLEPDLLESDAEFKDLQYAYLGIDFVHSLKNNAASPLDRVLALWSLIQVPPKGTMIVPVGEVVRDAWRANYFEPIPEDYVKANPDSFSYYLHGSRRYKVGIRPESARGVIAYVWKASRGDYALVFMSFPVKPEARYVDRPKTEQETNGDAIQIYSHLEKDALAFGELECHSWALDLKPGLEEAFPIKIYIYKATLETIKAIGKKLACPQFDKAFIFEEDKIKSPESLN